jgi:hypothetical protein
MIKDVIESIASATRKLFSNWGALLISFVLYVALIGVLYLFFTTREATTLQVVISALVLPFAAIVLFFTLQALCVSYVRIGVGALYLLKRALKDCWSLCLVVLPLILLAYFTAKIPSETDVKLMTPAMAARPTLAVVLAWARGLLLYAVFPLIAIHLWIIAAREGIVATIKGAMRHILHALSPKSILIYLLMVAVSGIIAYFLLFTKTPVQSEWGDLWAFGVRLALALIAIFLGWMITLGAMAEMTARHAMGELES